MLHASHLSFSRSLEYGLAGLAKDSCRLSDDNPREARSRNGFQTHDQLIAHVQVELCLVVLFSYGLTCHYSSLLTGSGKSASRATIPRPAGHVIRHNTLSGPECSSGSGLCRPDKRSGRHKHSDYLSPSRRRPPGAAFRAVSTVYPARI